MKELKILIYKTEDIVLLMQGLNWIRHQVLNDSAKIITLCDKMDDAQKGVLLKTIDEQVDTYDRLLSLISQLDEALEKVDRK